MRRSRQAARPLRSSRSRRERPSTSGASTEAILRSGDGTVVLSSGAAGGFTDVTSGRDTVAGEAVLANHHLVCPRNDGRGIKAESKLYIMIKGAYDIR